MYIVHVQIQVKPGSEDAFIAATLANARNSVQEPGIARFDVLRETADSSRFVLVEVYRDAEAAVRHKETAHYATWRDTVAGMMVVPRIGVKLENLFPDDGGWG
jgi:quinol monooxygenase YgiN